MSEKNSNIMSAAEFAERHRQKTNESMRKELDVSPDGYLLFPGEPIDITVDRAIELATSIVREYSLDIEAERIKAGKSNFGLDRQVLATKKEFLKHTKTESLLKILSYHKENPHHYEKEQLLAVSEELLERLTSPTGVQRK